MITPKEIKDKAERKYISFLQSLVENKPFEKLVIRGDKSYTKSSLSEFEKELQQTAHIIVNPSNSAISVSIYL